MLCISKPSYKFITKCNFSIYTHSVIVSLLFKCHSIIIDLSFNNATYIENNTLKISHHKKAITKILNRTLLVYTFRSVPLQRINAKQQFGHDVFDCLKTLKILPCKI